MRKISATIANHLISRGASSEMRDVYAYGIECTLSVLIILVALMIAGTLLMKPIHMLVFIAAWLPLRMIVGGAHANTHLKCTLLSVGLGIASVYISDYIRCIPVVLTIALLLSCYIVFFATAPVIHKNHPISQTRYRKTRTIARIYAAAECAVIVILMFEKIDVASSALLGYLSTAVLLLIGWFDKNTDKTVKF